MIIRNLSKEYEIKNGQPVHALKGVSFELPEKGMVFLLGKSGSGKTTLLKTLAGLEVPSEGEIVFRGKDIAKLTSAERSYYRNTYCGFIFQEYNLLSEFNVEENLSLALEMKGERETEEAVKKVLKQVELSGYEKRRITELSGGQRQRVAIARALIKDPDIIFADEPTGALDSETGENVLSVLKKLSKEKLVLIVTHDRDITEKYADRVIELVDGQILSDSDQNQENSEEKAFTLRKTKLPTKTAFKIGLNYFKFHPIRLWITVFLSVIVFTLFGLTASVIFADLKDVTADSMMRSDIRTAIIRKYEKDGRLSAISEPEYADVLKYYNISALPIFESDFKIEELNEVDFAPFYDAEPFAVTFKEGQEVNAFSSDIIGSAFISRDEAMITGYLADRFIAAKIVSSKEELIGKVITIFGEEYRVAGIWDTHFDSGKYDRLKDKASGERENILQGEFTREMGESLHNLIVISRDAFRALEESDEPVFSGLITSLNGLSKRQLLKLQGFSLGGNEFGMVSVVIDEVRNALSSVDEYSILLIVLCAVFGIFAVVLLFYMISQSIEEKMNTIAILKTMGAGKTDIRKIFLSEAILIGFITALLSLLLIVVLSIVLNNILSGNIPLLIFGLRWKEVGMLCATIFVFSVFGVLIPIGRMKKNNIMRFIGS